MDRYRVVELLAEFTRLKIDEGISGYHFAPQYTDNDVVSCFLSDEELDALAERVTELQREESAGLTFFSSSHAEIAVDDTSSHRPLRMREDLLIEDSARGLEYRLGKSSVEFAIATADLLASIPRGERPNRAYYAGYRHVRGAEPGALDPLQILVESLRVSTLRIASDKRRSKSEWGELAESFYFQVGYNLDYAIVPREVIADLLRSGRIQRLRRSKPDDIEAPRRAYISELVRSYQLALSSESAMLSFLSFYHVAEHWFEEIFLDDVAAKVRATVTDPGFSAKRKADLRNLIKIVSKSLRARDEEFVISEISALELTILRYVDLDELRVALTKFDSELVDYYISSTVPFSEGNRIKFDASSHEELARSISARIYKTRNSLVHRKEGNRGRFTPFKDDRALQRELPLMRFIAEQIIIATSSIA